LTGNEALKAHRRADLLSEEVKTLSEKIQTQLANNKDNINVNVLIKQIVELNNSINAAQVS